MKSKYNTNQIMEEEDLINDLIAKTCTTKPKESGYYWYCARCDISQAQKKSRWTLTYVNVLTNEKVGVFVGPLVEPTNIFPKASERLAWE